MQIISAATGKDLHDSHASNIDGETSMQQNRQGKSDQSAVIKARPDQWPHDASLSPERTELVIIDMQRDRRYNSKALSLVFAFQSHPALQKTGIPTFQVTSLPNLPPSSHITAPEYLSNQVCSPGGYLDNSGASITQMRAIIPAIAHLLQPAVPSEISQSTTPAKAIAQPSPPSPPAKDTARKSSPPPLLLLLLLLPPQRP